MTGNSTCSGPTASLEKSHTCSRTYVSSVSVSTSARHSGVAAWPPEPKILVTWPWTRKLC